VHVTAEAASVANDFFRASSADSNDDLLQVARDYQACDQAKLGGRINEGLLL
jgi:hypothetical protein